MIGAAALAAAFLVSSPSGGAETAAAIRAEAVRWARLHDALAAHARRDPAARRAAVERLEGRAWAYRAVGRVLDGPAEGAFETVVREAPAPAAVRDLAYLLALVPGRETDAIAAVRDARGTFVLGEDLLLEAAVRSRLGEPISASVGVLERLIRANPARLRAITAALEDHPLPRRPLGEIDPILDRIAVAVAAAVVAHPDRPNPAGRVVLTGAIPAGDPVWAVITVGGGDGGEETVPAVRWGEGDRAGVVVDLPGTAPVGPATIRVGGGGETSPAARVEVVDWPLTTPTEPAEAIPLAAAGVLVPLPFDAALDSVAALVEPVDEDDRVRVWTPVGRGAATTWGTSWRWRVPEIAPGRRTVVWAGRTGGVWGLAGEGTIDVETEPPPPRGLVAAYHYDAVISVLYDDARATFVPAALRPGDLRLASPDLRAGEAYRVAWTSGARDLRCDADDFLVVPAGPAAPETVAVALVVGGRPGRWSEAVEVEVIGEPPPMPPPPEARRPPAPGVAVEPAPRTPATRALEFLARVEAALDRWRRSHGRNPTEFEILHALRLDAGGAETWLPSPWGGAWSYHPTPGHNSATLLARDTDGRLAAQWHDGGVENGLVAYDDVAADRTAPVAVAVEDLVWVPPWEGATLGRFAAEAVRAAAGADVGIANALGLRGNLPRGIVTDGHLRHAHPWANRIAVLDLRGLDLREILIRGGDERWFLHTAGARPAPQNVRFGIPSFEVVLDGGAPLDDSAVYRVAVPAYLADGGDGYVGFRRALRREDLALGVQEAIAARLIAR